MNNKLMVVFELIMVN